MSQPSFQGERSRQLEEVQRAYCFDYDELVKNYHINLVENSLEEPEDGSDLFENK